MTVDGCVTSHPSPEINVPFWWMYLQLFKLRTHLPSTFLQTPFTSSSNILLRNSGLIAELLQGDLTLLLARSGVKRAWLYLRSVSSCRT